MLDFSYRPLTAPRTIRLVHLLPPEPHSHDEGISLCRDEAHGTLKKIPVQCTVSTVALDCAPPYTALSYTWGCPKDQRDVFIDGFRIGVHKNLEIALRHLRLHDRPRDLWIDAICINQQDNREKNEQLELMREVYVHAESVVAWLGYAEQDSSSAMSWIKQYGGQAYELGLGTKPALRLHNIIETLETEGADSMGPEMKSFIADLKVQLSPPSPEHAKLLPALTDLFDRPYWKRMWMVQELRSASRLTFVCGKIEVTDDAMHHALRLLRNWRAGRAHQFAQGKLGVETTLGKTIDRINLGRPISLLKVRRAPADLPLIYLMRTFRISQATDPKDKFFALLGISSDTQAMDLHPDYDKAAATVYTLAARKLVEHGFLEILSLCEQHHQIQGLQSWVPDWSGSGNSTPLQRRSIDRTAKPLRTFLEPSFSAGRDSTRAEHPQPYQSSQDRSQSLLDDAPLQIQVMHLGNVSYVQPSYTNDNIGGWLASLLELTAFTPSISMSPELRLDAALRTAVADTNFESSRKARLSGSTTAAVASVLASHDLRTVSAQVLLDAGHSSYAEQLRAVARRRMPILVDGRYLAVGPCGAQVGDGVFVLVGGDVPVVLRKGASGRWLLVGEAYVHGVMDGEALRIRPPLEEMTVALE